MPVSCSTLTTHLSWLCLKRSSQVSARDAEAFFWKSGDYSVEIIIGDATLKPLRWTLGTFRITFPTVEEAAKPSPFDPLPLFDYVFRPPEPRPPFVVSLFFTALALAPWVGLLAIVRPPVPPPSRASAAAADLPAWGPSPHGSRLQWGRLGVNVKNFPPKGAGTAAIVFHASVAGMFAVLFWYWVGTTIFQALAYLSVLAVIAVFSGRTTLSAIALQRT